MEYTIDSISIDELEVKFNSNAKGGNQLALLLNKMMMVFIGLKNFSTHSDTNYSKHLQSLILERSAALIKSADSL